MRKHSNTQAFYSVIVLLNAMVGAVFFMMIVPLPKPVEAAPIVIHSPIKPKVIPAVVGVPSRLVVPSLQLNLHVATGSYDTVAGDWTSSQTDALYADTSMPANDSNGTTLIYGHAQTAVFASLPALRPGAEAVVYTPNHVFHYKYQSSKLVLPSDTTVFTSHGAPKLVLQTCSGAWDAYRSLYSFTFIKATAKA